MNFHKNPTATHGKCFEYTREAIRMINCGLPIHTQTPSVRHVTRAELDTRATALAKIDALDSKYLLED